MKTNITMNSKDRVLFGITIRQDTKNEFLSVSDLQKAYAIAREEKGWSDKRIEHILATNTSAERCYYLLKNRNLIKTDFTVFIEDVNNQGLTKVLKSYGVYSTKGRGENKTVMCDAQIWVLLALELNPELYATVVMWLTDRLILHRITSGDNYNVLMTEVGKLPFSSYTEVAKALNWIVFNKHERDIRNTATEEQLEDLHKLEEMYSNALERGWITDYDQLIQSMKDEYKKRHRNNK